MDLVSPEPYRVWEYYNQKCSIAQAFDILINDKGIRDLPKPTLRLSQEEMATGFNVLSEVKTKTKKDKIIVIQPFGRGVRSENNLILDPSNRSIEGHNIVNIVKKLQTKYAVVLMSELGIDFTKHGCKDPVAHPQNMTIRQWAGLIANCDYFLGCDSVGQHIAYALNKPASIVLGSTFGINVSYPDSDIIEVLDLGDERRTYSPIRITMDEVADRGNDGIMVMNEDVENAVVNSVVENIKKFSSKDSTLPVNAVAKS